MYSFSLFFVLVLTSPVLSVWQCTLDADCSELVGSICRAGDCSCPAGQQAVRGGTLCVDFAPDFTSTCLEDFQCTRLSSAFECRKDNQDEETGSCYCQPGHHYYLGRCWLTVHFGEACTHSEQCLGAPRDPFNLACEDNVCGCAPGFYMRQRGECRRIGNAVGDGCVLDEDCQFTNGACDHGDLSCYDTTNPSTVLNQKVEAPPTNQQQAWNATIYSGVYGEYCNFETICQDPYVCSLGACFCPIGYYINAAGTGCLAQLGSPSTPAQCVGLFAEVRNGVCVCYANFHAEENMRDCVKAARTITDSCVLDEHCTTFGLATRCGAPQDPWGLRSCECDTERAVWEADRQICRLFAGVGEECEVDSDCLAGELEIQCVTNNVGQGICTCPEGYFEQDGLCLTTGLALNDTCQATVECTETPNTICLDSRCSCDPTGYQELDGYCAPVIGGECIYDEDCVIENTICLNETAVPTCQCSSGYVAYDNACWRVSLGIYDNCEVDIQCRDALGEASICTDNACVCTANYHFRENGCWPVTGLFEACSRTSQCYLSGISELVVCRNSLCQCDHDFPYSEELQTCLSSATNAIASSLLVLSALIYLKWH